MPSLALPDHPFSEAAKDKKEKKNKKMKNTETVNGDLETDSPISEKKKKKESKKRKALEIEEEEERSETSSELVEPVNSKAEDSEKEKKKRKKTAKVEEEEEGEEGKSEEDPNAISRFRISEPLRAKLKEKGITSLFPIQAMTFDTVLDGSDLVGRARTGQGKTLAFVLPILESITNGPAKGSRKTGYGRSPSVLVLLPTRELASQVYADFEVYGGALGLVSCCLYGGSPYHSQEIKLKRGVDIVVGTPAKGSRKTGYGKVSYLSVLVRFYLLGNDGSIVSLRWRIGVGVMLFVWHGSPYHSQEIKLKRGVDIVVGTPGRVKDHIERVNIDLSSLKFRVLDEADEMLRMGFVEDVELILGKVDDASKVQTLLFSATLPDWVKQISSRFLKPNKKTADLVGNEKMKASANVRHIVLPCSSSARAQLIPDVIRSYSSGGRTIIFTETKDCASTLAGLLPGARALHGDIQQAQREASRLCAYFALPLFSLFLLGLVGSCISRKGLVHLFVSLTDVEAAFCIIGFQTSDIDTACLRFCLPCSTVYPSVLLSKGCGGDAMGGYELSWGLTTRSGKFLTLVATNVAARGLDINDVQLIIQCEPPRDVEAYIHRSGRTGRAGNTGVAVMLYDPRKSNVSRIERESGVKFEHISAPQQADIAKAAGGEAAEMITQVSDNVIPAFKSAAEELLKTSGLSAVELLAKALAKAAGYTEIKTRSLLASMEDHVTVLLEAGSPIYTPSFAFRVLRRFLPEEKVEAVKGLTLTADGRGAVFDVPAENLDSLLAGQENAADVRVEVVKALPRLQEREQSRGGRFGSSGRGSFGDRNGGRFSGGRGGRGGGGFSGRRNDRFTNGRGRKW
ncbi:DEAD-box ATP-dependent RNA helicase 7 [Morella rubra]|uniref:DEAD-box ATP-dependent RNA helicase 7 n=1 Tax=Morella rubra TaxID=262757 RepID=A0A6A1WC18_9ROSI|nr:DEAD-box ATP-dependent RNA helicase 7 [Morella rubra]